LLSAYSRFLKWFFLERHFRLYRRNTYYTVALCRPVDVLNQVVLAEATYSHDSYTMVRQPSGGREEWAEKL
jgi:hypothetical protein